MINKVRNSFAFHYSATSLAAGWEQATFAEYEVILGGTVGNNLFLGAEIVTNAAILKGIDDANLENALRIFFDDVQGMSNTFTMFFEGVSMLLSEKALGTSLGSSGYEEELAMTKPFSEVEIPYFCIPEFERN